MDINNLIDLDHFSGPFDSKKDIFEKLNKIHKTNYTYKQWYGYYRRHDEFAKKVDFLLYPNNDIIVDPLYLSGVSAKDQIPDIDQLLDDMMSSFDEAYDIHNRKQIQTVDINTNLAMIVNMADTHFGGTVDIKRLFNDVNLILNTPNVYINWLGDLTDNFCLNFFNALSIDRKYTIEEEKAISRHFIRKISSRLISFTMGNHDNWNKREVGFDDLKFFLSDLGSNAFFDDHENTFIVKVGSLEIPIKVRHKWTGNSLYNPHHGIVKGLISSPNIKIGIGAHLHRGSLIHEFIHGGERRISMLSGTYKVVDEYFKQQGFSPHDNSACSCIIFDENSDFGYYPISNLYDGIKIFNALRNT